MDEEKPVNEKKEDQKIVKKEPKKPDGKCPIRLIFEEDEFSHVTFKEYPINDHEAMKKIFYKLTGTQDMELSCEIIDRGVQAMLVKDKKKSLI